MPESSKISYSDLGYPIYPQVIRGCLIEVRMEAKILKGFYKDIVEIRALNHTSLSDWKSLDLITIGTGFQAGTVSKHQAQTIERFTHRAYGL